MRRELKAFIMAPFALTFAPVTRHIPMRRELKEREGLCCAISYELVTRHIPMRRELKVQLLYEMNARFVKSQGISR